MLRTLSSRCEHVPHTHVAARPPHIVAPRWLHAGLTRQTACQHYSNVDIRGAVCAHARQRKQSDMAEEQMDADMGEDILHAGDAVIDADDFEPEVDEDELQELEDDEDDEQMDYDAGEGEDTFEDAWDQALVNFPTEQDEVDIEQQSPEEARRAAALKLVRADEVSAGVEVEVEDVPEEQPPPTRTYEDQLSALTVQDKQLLMTNRQGYLEFEMDGMNLLVAETAEGRLNLTDGFLYEQSTDLYSRLRVGEGVPAEPLLYQAVDWDVTHSGDFLKFKDPKVQIQRMYFLPVLNDGSNAEDEYQVDLQRLYCFTTASKTLEQVPITPLSEEIEDPVLRIRPEGAFIEDTSDSWHWTAIAEGYGKPGVDYVQTWLDEMEKEDAQKGWSQQQEQQQRDQQSEQQLEERLEELELMEELDDVPDVPAVDLV